MPQSKAIKKPTTKPTTNVKLAAKLPKQTHAAPLIDATPSKSLSKSPVKSSVKAASKSPNKNVNKPAAPAINPNVDVVFVQKKDKKDSKPLEKSPAKVIRSAPEVAKPATAATKNAAK